METNRRYQVSQLDWLLDDLVLRVAHIERAVFLSQDGLALGASRGLDQADAEHLAALAAGFQSLARGAGRHFGGGEARQTIIEMSSGFLFVTAAGQGTCLAVLTGAEADVGLVAYEMAAVMEFLISPAASYVNGHAMVADGGALNGTGLASPATGRGRVMPDH